MQVPMQPPPLRVLLQPAAEPWPFPQQRLVRDLDLALPDRDQPVVDERGEHIARLPIALHVELRQRDAPAHDGRPFCVGLPREPQQDPARDLTLAGIELAVGGLGQPRHRTVHAAGVLVGTQPQQPTVAVQPELEQRGRQQRQRARLALDVRDQRVDEFGIDSQTPTAGRQLDRATKLVPAHRPDEHAVCAEQARELRIGRTATVVVGPQRDEHERSPALLARACDERVDERRPLGLVATRSEDLLELVDREDQPLLLGCGATRALDRLERTLPRAQQRDAPALAPRQRAAAQRRQQPCPQHGRLATPRRPDHADHRRRHRAGDDLRDEPLAAEEHVGVVDVERGEPLERARHRAVTVVERRPERGLVLQRQ
jgi:hypothetical protein